MKTFADLKRRLSLGTTVEITFHRLDAQATVVHGNTGTTTLPAKIMADQQRQISIVQSNAIAFKMANGRDSWLYWPKAKDVRIDGPDAFSILDEDGAISMSYRIL